MAREAEGVANGEDQTIRTLRYFSKIYSSFARVSGLAR
jgi:hypothetical protein